MANQWENLSRYLAKNLGALRERRRITQAQLASLSGIPRSTLTYLESGRGNPSLANLARLSETLQVRLEELLAKPHDESSLVRYAELPRQARARGMVEILPLLPEPVAGIQMERMELAPGGRMGGTPHLSGTREFFTCVAGRIALRVGEVTHELQPGDVLSFPGDQAHTYHNPAGTRAVGISVVALALG